MESGIHMQGEQGATPYCFNDAYWCLRKDKITQAEYIKRVVAHFGGVRHVDFYHDPDDENDDGICPRIVFDRFATAVRQVTVEKNYRPVRDLKSYEKLFNDCIENRYEDVVKNLASLRAKKPVADPTQPLAVLAALHGRSKILHYCLAKGAVLDRNLARGISEGAGKDPDLEKFIDENIELFEDLLQTRLDENGDMTGSEMDEFDVIEW